MILTQWVLVNAGWVVVAALAPVTVARYGVAGHELWLVCSLVAVASFVGMFIVWRRTPEAREAFSGVSRAEGLRGMAMSEHDEDERGAHGDKEDVVA